MEREARNPQIVFPAGGMSMLDGPTNGAGPYKAYSLSATRTGQLSRMAGKTATGNLGVPIMGFVNFWSPTGFIINITQTGGTVGTVIGNTVTIPGGSTAITQYYGYWTDPDGYTGSETLDSGITGSVTQLTSGEWFADYTADAKDVSCNDVTLSGTLTLVGQSPFSYEVNTCVIISACGLPGRGVKITSDDGIQTCYLTGAGFLSFTPTYRQVLPTWRVVISSATQTLVDEVVSSATEPSLNLP